MATIMAMTWWLYDVYVQSPGAHFWSIFPTMAATETRWLELDTVSSSLSPPSGQPWKCCLLLYLAMPRPWPFDSKKTNPEWQVWRKYINAYWSYHGSKQTWPLTFWPHSLNSSSLTQDALMTKAWWKYFDPMLTCIKTVKLNVRNSI